jgi:outer membrane immunogenic protein
MKRLFWGISVLAVVLLAVGPVNADDFNGFYIGVNGGGAQGNSHATTTTVFSPTGYFAASSVPAIATAGNQKLSSNGFTVGGQMGFNIQFHRLVIGLEADGGAMNLSQQKTSGATYPCCAPTAFTITQFTGTTYLVALRPRIGFTFRNLLIYGTAGLAVTDFEFTEQFRDTFANANESGRKTRHQAGWAAGGGVEYKVRKRWSIKGEALHYDFGHLTTTSTNLTAFTPPISFPTNVFTHSASLNGNIYRGGLNFHF